EPSHFDFLSRIWLPELAQRKNESRRVRAWSAGCSSGQEAYSLAIVLREAFAANESWDIRILASDISRQMLRVAIDGGYDTEQVLNLPPLQRDRYFVHQQRGSEPCVRVSQSLRDLVRFRYVNLMQQFPFTGTFDFIFCRNVMIYFDKTTQEHLVNRLGEHLE